MKVFDLVKYMRESILDDLGGSNVVWGDITEDSDSSAQLRWSNEELVSFLTQAEREIARRAQVLDDDTGLYDITTISGTNEYALDPKILEVLEAEYDGKQLSQVQTSDLRKIYKWRDQAGVPSAIAMDAGTRKIIMYPNPDSVYPISIVVRRLPLIDLSWETAESASPEIPEFHHFGMLNYAAYLAYMKDEANSLDPSRAGQYKSLFEQDYPAVSMSAEVKKLRNRGRTVNYGGIR